MKAGTKKKHLLEFREENENLSGLLSSYKKYNCYLRLLVNEESKRVALVLTDNPLNWNHIPLERLENFVRVKRVKIPVRKLSIKYILPQHIINYLGPTLRMSMILRNVQIDDYLDKKGKGYFIIEAPMKYYGTMSDKLRNLVDLSPQLKYEMIVKYFSKRS